MNTRIPTWLALALVCSGISATARAEVIRDDKLNFTLTLPEGFRDFPEGKEQQALTYSFIQGTPGTQDFTIVGIKPMGGIIGREALEKKDLPHFEGVKFDLRREKWKSFDIDVMVGTARQEDLAVFVAVAQVPLKKEAIQIMTAGPEAHKADVLAMLRTLLASLDGPSNWLTDAERSMRLGKVAGGLLGALAIAGLVVWMTLRKPRKVS